MIRNLSIVWVLCLAPLGAAAQQPSAVPPTGNVAVVHQSGSGSSQVSITQVGRGNTATIQQGLPDSTGRFTHVVISTQTAGGQTVIRQRQGGQAISIHQSGPVGSAPIEKTGKPN